MLNAATARPTRTPHAATVPFSLLLDLGGKNDMSGTSLRLSLTFPLPKHRAQPSPARGAAAKPSCRDNLRPVRQGLS